MTRSISAVVILTLCALLVAAPALADDATDAMSRAGKAYGSGDYKTASMELQTALVAVNQLLIDQLIGALPDAPSGWTAEDPEGIDTSAIGAGFFASLVVTRGYTAPDGSRIEMTVSANSPLLMSLRMFVSNPMMASMTGQTGMKKSSACGYDTIEHFGDGTFETHVLAGNATLISVTGSKESDIAHIKTLTNATDCKTIVSIVE
jgi:hypothetical protein